MQITRSWLNLRRNLENTKPSSSQFKLRGRIYKNKVPFSVTIIYQKFTGVQILLWWVLRILTAFFFPTQDIAQIAKLWSDLKPAKSTDLAFFPRGPPNQGVWNRQYPVDAKLYSKRSETIKELQRKALQLGSRGGVARSKESYTNELHPGIFPDELLRMSQIY